MKHRTTDTAWMVLVRHMLSDGYGVEDIAHLLRCNVEHVRLEVKILRDMGVLRHMFRRRHEPS